MQPHIPNLIPPQTALALSDKWNTPQQVGDVYSHGLFFEDLTYTPNNLPFTKFLTYYQAGLLPPTNLPRFISKKKEDIKEWLDFNYFRLAYCGISHLGNEANQQPASMFDTAKVRMIIVRCSDYETMDGAFGHHIITNFIQDYGGDDIFCDVAFRPADEDYGKYINDGVPLAFGAISKQPLSAFDIVIFSTSYPIERVNIPALLKYSGIPVNRHSRMADRQFVSLEAAQKLQAMQRAGNNPLDAKGEPLFSILTTTVEGEGGQKKVVPVRNSRKQIGITSPYRNSPIIAVAGLGAVSFEPFLDDHPLYGPGANAIVDCVLNGEGEMMDLKFAQLYMYYCVEGIPVDDAGKPLSVELINEHITKMSLEPDTQPLQTKVFSKVEFLDLLNNDQLPGYYNPTRVLFEYGDKHLIEKDHTGEVLRKEVFESGGPIQRISFIDKENQELHVVAGHESDEFRELNPVNAHYLTMVRGASEEELQKLRDIYDVQPTRKIAVNPEIPEAAFTGKALAQNLDLGIAVKNID